MNDEKVMVMFGFLIGLLCGALEFKLLALLVDGIAKERIRVWVIPAKMGVLALFLVPCAIWFRSQLLVAGITAALTLIVLSVLRFVVLNGKQEGKESQ